jgi:hypothetical protein
MAVYGMGTSIVDQHEKVKKPTICKKTYVYRFVGLTSLRLECYRERGITVNSTYYSKMFSERLKPGIQPLLKGITPAFAWKDCKIWFIHSYTVLSAISSFSLRVLSLHHGDQLH